jgi:hypothetical protein
VHAGAQSRRRLEKRSHPRPRGIGLRRDDRYDSSRHPCEHAGLHDHCAR